MLNKNEEYAIALKQTHQNIKFGYHLLGETPVGGGPTLGIQPHKGSLFKSHNNSVGGNITSRGYEI